MVASVSKDEALRFEKSKDFEVIRVFDNGYKSVVVFFRGLGNSLDTTKNLPEDWSKERFVSQHADLYRADEHQRNETKGLGTLVCQACGYRRKHNLKWPEDAWYIVEYRGRSLWASNLREAHKLLDFIKSKDRLKRVEIDSNFQDRYLRKIPTHFLTAKARGTIVRKLEAMVGPTTEKEVQK